MLQNFENFHKISPGWLAGTIEPDYFLYPAHIAYLDKILCRAIGDGSSRLLINMPPRHGKSELFSKYLPFWHLCRFPDRRVILASYESAFAQSWGRKVMALILEHGGNFGLSLSGKSHSAQHFELEGHRGSMSCVGAGGPITGKGADLLIIDDPVKNDAEANSPAARDSVHEWFRATAFTRLEPGGSAIIVMTRWHEDDLAGRLAKEKSSKWRVVSIPALAEKNDPLGRKPGDALWPGRFSRQHLSEIKSSLGAYWFSALYQQKPSPSGGGVFRKGNFRYYERSGDILSAAGRNISIGDCTVFAVADLAAKATERSDYTVCLVFALSAARDIFILDIYRDRFEPAGHLKLLGEVYRRYRPAMIGIESVQYQYSLVARALAEGLPVKELRPDRDKLSRALPMAAKLESGKVYFPRDAPWLHDFESELLAFPNGAHDDQADCFAYIAAMIAPVSGEMPGHASVSRFGRDSLVRGF